MGNATSSCHHTDSERQVGRYCRPSSDRNGPFGSANDSSSTSFFPSSTLTENELQSIIFESLEDTGTPKNKRRESSRAKQLKKDARERSLAPPSTSSDRRLEQSWEARLARVSSEPCLDRGIAVNKSKKSLRPALRGGAQSCRDIFASRKKSLVDQLKPTKGAGEKGTKASQQPSTKQLRSTLKKESSVKDLNPQQILLALELYGSSETDTSKANAFLDIVKTNLTVDPPVALNRATSRKSSRTPTAA